jgi:hypothetical protein
MRFLCSLAAFAALVVLAPAEALAQFSITNYSLVSETRVTRSISDFEYRATVTNTGAARPNLSATLVSASGTTLVVRGHLHFVNVPANGSALSSDTFIIRVDRLANFNLAHLGWSFSGPNAPIANAGPSQTKGLTQTVQLNGSGSTNPSGIGTLFYTWVMISKPANSTAALSGINTVNPTFVIDLHGVYVISLTVNNGVGIDTAYVVISTSNSPPVANAGPNKSVPIGTLATLNGALSTDVDGNPLTFAWTITNKPVGSNAVLNNPTSVTPSFTPDIKGAYTIQLIVNDGTQFSAPSTTIVSTTNTAPVANAGPNQMVNVDGTAQLTGAASTDVDGDALTYLWSLISKPVGSTAALNNTTIVNPTFVADLPGSYVAQLIVNDGITNSLASTVTISTNAVPAPIANAGSPQTVLHGSTVQLNGSAVDPGNRPITFAWSFTSKPVGGNAVFSNPAIANPTFVADRPGNYIAQLIASNPFSSSTPVTVTITTTNSTPVANAGSPQTVATGTLVTLNGTASSDADNDPLTYAWTFSSRPGGSSANLLAPTSPSPTFTPDVVGSYVVQLIVSDAFISSTPVTVTITAVAPGQIILPATTNVAPGATVAFPVTLSSAALNPVTITLVPNPGANVNFSTLTVNIPQGATAPVTQPTVTGVLFGAVTVNATGNGVVAGSGTVNVNGTINLTPPSVSIIGTATQNLTVTLSVPAPAGGLVIGLQSTDPAVATVPANVTILAGATQATIPVTGVAPGASTIIATPAAATVPPANATANVIGTLTITTATLPNGSQGVAYSQQLASTGGTGSKTWSLISGNLPNGITVSPSGLIAGTTSTLVTDTPLTFQVVDSGTPTPQTATKNLTLSIVAVTPTTIVATSGTPQSATVNTQFATAFTVTVTGAGGAPASGVTVTFTAPASGASGTFAGGVNTATTDNSGVATSALFTANGTVGGPYNVAATVSGVGTPANFVLTNTAVAPTTIVATSGTPQSATITTAFGAQLVATVTGAGGAPASGVTVTFTPPASGASGTFAGGVNTATTDANGVATSAVFTANGTAGGPYNVVASVSGVATPANFALTNTAVVPTTIVVTSGSPQSASVNSAFALPLVATVTGAGGLPAAGVTVTFTPPASGASGTFTGGNTAVTNASGVATSNVFTANATDGGPYNVAATVAGVGTPANFVLTNTVVVATTIVATSGTPQSALTGAAFGAQLVATVTGAGGAPAAGVTVTFTPPASGASGTFAGGNNTAVTDVNGVATSAVFTANSIPGGPYNVVASVSGVGTPANFVLTNTQRTIATLTASGGTPQATVINTAFGQVLSVTALDATSQPVSGATITFNVPASGASATIAGGNTAVTNASGIAVSGVVTANATAGNYAITATSPGVTAASFNMTNTAGAAASIVVTSGSPQTTTVGTAFGAPLVATVRDAGNNPVVGATVTFAPPGAGASATIAGGNTAITGANGQATSGVVTANTVAGSYNIGASVPSVAGVNFAMTNNPGPAATVTATSGTPQNAGVGAAFAAPLVATVRDANNNVVPGVTVTFTPPASGASATIAGGNSYVTNASGVVTTGTVTANATAGGPYNVVASASGASSANFALTNVGAAVAALIGLNGANQNPIVNTALPIQFSARVKDGSNNPVSGVTVTFTAPGAGASGTFPGALTVVNVQTDAQGLATAPTFTANGTAGGPYNVVATSGALTPVNYAVTNVAALSGQTIHVTNATVGKGLQTPITVTLSQPAPPGGLSLAFTTLDNTKVLVAGRAGDAGTTQVSLGACGASCDIKVPEGLTSVTGLYVHGIVDTGTANISVSASGWTTGVATVTLTPAGFVIAGPGGATAPDFTTASGLNTPITATAMRLTPTLDIAQIQQVRGSTSVNVPVTSGTPSVGTIPASIVVTSELGSAGSSTGSANFSALTVGSSLITQTTPVGFATPNDGRHSVTANVAASALIAPALTVGRNLQVQAQLSVNAPPPSNLPILLTSNDPSKLLFAYSPTGAGQATIGNDQANFPFRLTSGFLVSTPFYVYALTDTGTATFTATVDGYAPVTGTVTFGKSGFVLNTPVGNGLPFNLTAGSQTILRVRSYLLDGTNAPLTQMAVMGGLNPAVNVVSATTSVGTIGTSPVIFAGGEAEKETIVTAVGGGTSVISINTAVAGFTTPSSGSAATLTVNAPGIGVTGAPDAVNIGKDLQIPGSFFLGAQATAGLVVTITSNDPTSILLAKNASDAGSASITFTMNAGGISGNYFIQALKSTGSATFTASAPGFTPRTGTVNFAPSGIVITGPNGFVNPNAFATNQTIFGKTVFIFTDILNPVTLASVGEQDLRGGLTLTGITFASSAGLGVSFPPVSIVGGSGSGFSGIPVTFTSTSQGITNISVNAPAGFSQPTGTYGSVTVTINN